MLATRLRHEGANEGVKLVRGARRPMSALLQRGRAEGEGKTVRTRVKARIRQRTRRRDRKAFEPGSRAGEHRY